MTTRQHCELHVAFNDVRRVGELGRPNDVCAVGAVDRSIDLALPEGAAAPAVDHVAVRQHADWRAGKRELVVAAERTGQVDRGRDRLAGAIEESSPEIARAVRVAVRSVPSERISVAVQSGDLGQLTITEAGARFDRGRDLVALRVIDGRVDQGLVQAIDREPFLPGVPEIVQFLS